MKGEELEREDEAKVKGAWIQKMNSDEETEHFIYPAEGKERSAAETT